MAKKAKEQRQPKLTLEERYLVIIDPNYFGGAQTFDNKELLNDLVSGHNLLTRNEILDYLNEFCEDNECVLDEKDFVILEVLKVFSPKELNLSEKTSWTFGCGKTCCTGE